jgi:hypothetical protein
MLRLSAGQRRGKGWVGSSRQPIALVRLLDHLHRIGRSRPQRTRLPVVKVAPNAAPGGDWTHRAATPRFQQPARHRQDHPCHYRLGPALAHEDHLHGVDERPGSPGGNRASRATAFTIWALPGRTSPMATREAPAARLASECYATDWIVSPPATRRLDRGIARYAVRGTADA